MIGGVAPLGRSRLTLKGPPSRVALVPYGAHGCGDAHDLLDEVVGHLVPEAELRHLGVKARLGLHL